MSHIVFPIPWAIAMIGRCTAVCPAAASETETS